jgi:hypothetical protein
MNKKTKGKRKNKTGIIIISIFLFFLILIIIFIRNASPIIIAISEAKINAMVTASVNNAISGTISDSLKYENLVDETKDENGNTKTLSANVPAINELGNNIVCLSEKINKKMLEPKRLKFHLVLCSRLQFLSVKDLYIM